MFLKKKTKEEREQEAKKLNKQKFHDACKACDLQTVRRMVEEGKASAKEEEESPAFWGASHKESPIHLVLQGHTVTDEFWRSDDNVNNFLEIIELFLVQGADPNAIYEDYDWRGCGSAQPAFQLALTLAVCGQEPWRERLLTMFIKHGADVNKAFVAKAHTMRYDGCETYCPLHYAVRYGSLQCVRILLEAGAVVDTLATNKGESEYGHTNDTKETALHIAAGCMEPDMYYYLLSEESEELIKQADALLAEAKRGIIELLLRSGADINAIRCYVNNVDESPDDSDGVARSDPRQPAYVSSIRSIVVRETPLHLAILRGDEATVRQLLEAGADRTIERVYGEEKQTTWDLCARILQDPAKRAAVEQIMQEGVGQKENTKHE